MGALPESVYIPLYSLSQFINYHSISTLSFLLNLRFGTFVFRGGMVGKFPGRAHYFWRPPKSRPRLRWSKDQFVNAVNELGGTEKNWNIMRVEGFTLFHIKSHLQKYRIGKIARRLMRWDVLPANDATPKDIMNKMGAAEVDRYHIKSHLQKCRNGKISKRLLTTNAVLAGQRNIPENHEQMGSQGFQVESQKSDEMTETPPPLRSDKLEKGIDKFPEWAGLVDEDHLEPIVPKVNSRGYTSDPISAITWTITSSKSLGTLQ